MRTCAGRRSARLCAPPEVIQGTRVLADHKQLVEQLEGRFRDALCGQDRDRLGDLVHRDFTLIGTRSEGPFRMGRDEWLEAIERRDIRDIQFEVQDSVELGDVLIGTVLARWKLNYLGQVVDDCVILTDVWARDDGEWKAIRRHSSPAPTGSCGKAR